MLLIDGKPHSFKKGETHLRITVNEITPPRVRLTYDNVTWNASLFDRHEKTLVARAAKGQRSKDRQQGQRSKGQRCKDRQCN